MPRPATSPGETKPRERPASKHPTRRSSRTRKCIIHSGKGGGKGGGGKGEIVAYDLKDGSETWKWAGDAPAYASPVLMTVKGTKIVVTMTEASAVGIALADGKLLFTTAFQASRYGNTVTLIVDGTRSSTRDRERAPWPRRSRSRTTASS